MEVRPARLDQVRRGRDGRMHLIDADVGGVAEQLRRIDPHLKVRFAEAGNPPYFVVYWESDDGRDAHLVLTQKAWQNHAGVWEGLHQGIVERIEKIDPRGRGGYDFAAEVQRQNEQAVRDKKRRLEERVGEHGAELAHAIRKDLHMNQSRAFIPDVPA